MLCATCRGTGRVRHFVPFIVGIEGGDIYANWEEPCPDCIGGVAHCCEGDRAEPENDNTGEAA